MRTRTFAGWLGLVAATTYVATAACGSSTFSGDDAGSSDAGSDGSDTIVNPNCDHTQLPSQNNCVLDDLAGVFVSGPTNGGSDSADGTRAHPFATIQKGIATAKDAKKRVYVCIGDYAEQIALADGVSIFGDLDCTAEWKYVPTQHARIKAPSSPAAKADKISDPTRIEGLDITAADGTLASRSSIALIVTASPALTVANATILAGNGLDGVDGVEGIQLTQTTSGNGGAAGSGGVAENPAITPHADIQSCPGYFGFPSAHCEPNPSGGGTTSCAAPADAGVDAASLQPGSGGPGGAGGLCVLADSNQPMGMFNVLVASCTGSPGPGTAGTGVAPVGGTNGQNGVASLSATGYVVGDGTSGTSGGPGQGGAGGAGINPFFSDSGSHTAGGLGGQGVSGSGGGSGGCPGLSGTFGTGGGASIAIITDTVFLLDTCVVRSGNGGKAGQGTFGSSPTGGGAGGTPIGTGGAGAHGTAGSPSGWSGNGTAGPSYGIAVHGSVPTFKSTTPQVGAGGKGVAARTQDGKTIPPTPDGDSKTTFAF